MTILVFDADEPGVNARPVTETFMMVFLHVPKTAGTSFRFVLENTFGLAHCHANHTRLPVFGEADLRFARKVFPGLRSIAGHCLIDPPSLPFENPFYMTFLREPIARVISHYQDRVVRQHLKETFEQSLRRREELENLHVKLMAGGNNLDKARRFLDRCGFVGLTEQFNLSLHVLGRLSPCPLNLNYRRKVVARDNTVKNSILGDSRLLDMAREYNKLDLELYDHAVKEVFPRLCQRAGIDPSAAVPSFEIDAGQFKWRYFMGRMYNRAVFRQLCKVFVHAPAPGKA